MVKVRFAPSPTGFLHIGGARTALFNWMYAKAQNGTFVLRIEDTDLERSEKCFEEEILDSMKWLGMDYDELYHQSERFDIYREHAQKLVDEGKAYKDGEAVMLKMTEKQLKIYDLIRGEVDFDTANFIKRDENMKPILDDQGNEQLRDEVLIKSDGSPAYSFCCAIDDALMEITCVVRGEDHISNTPRQLMIYEALGFKPPKFAHLPLILGEDGARLSKRTGAVAVSDYRKEGFLPDALINYLMLLGWSPGNDQEVIEIKNAIKKFSIKKINKAAAIFAMDKLKWMNNQYLKTKDADELAELLLPLLEEKGYISEEFDRQRLKSIVELFKGRITTLNDFVEWTDFAFTDDFDVDEEAKTKHLNGSTNAEIKAVVEAFEAIKVFDHTAAYDAYKEVAEKQGFKPGDMIHPLRVAITGKAIGPSLFEIIGILGQETTIKRLKKVIS